MTYRLLRAGSAVVLPLLLVTGCAFEPGGFALLQDGGERARRAVEPPPEPPADLPVPSAAAIAGAVDEGLRGVLAMEESLARGDAADALGEWPYQGVYRVKGQIPIGYRVGGTAICCQAMTRHPAYAQDEAMRAAVARGVAFVCASTSHELMSAVDYDGGYDVRAWGYIYALWFLVDLDARGLVPAPDADAVAEATRFYLKSLHALEIPEAGGWNYARPPGRDRPSAPSPFMTGPALQALFAARAQGHEVDAAVVGRALDALERGEHKASGEVVYAGAGDRGRPGGVPGGIGRTCAAMTALSLGGRADVDDVRTAVQNFFEHWEWLEVRRRKTGTHVAPYGVAPYYFFFAHHAVAQAIECLPEGERQPHRDRLAALLFHIRDNDTGTWNDRVFDRSANYGTSMACLALLMAETGLPAAWSAPDTD